jgi:hypothetical protein
VFAGSGEAVALGPAAEFEGFGLVWLAPLVGFCVVGLFGA